ncbi:MAG TPA: Gmad2 immunoglobulin-like domain-containing protein [Anaerolineales bacterium]
MMLLAILLTSCRSFASNPPTPGPVFEPTLPPEIPSPAPDYVTRLRNADYQPGFTDVLRVVPLTDGKFEEGTPGGADFVSILMTDFTARGDLNNDGTDEYIALVSENYGGTGIFVFLAVFADVNGELAFQTSAWVDDRPQVNELMIGNGEIFLDATVHKTDEPMCCPTLKTARHYRLVNNQLDMADYVTFTPDGRPRTITIESPADGTEVFSSVQITGNVAIAPFENNLEYHIYDLGGVELAIGSITVSAPDLGAPGTFDEDILLGSILSGAVIRIEVQDVNAEDGSLFAMDSVELVVK